MPFNLKDLRQSPSAAALSEALRGVGYSVETALADLIDNSISAGARNVWISLSAASGQPRMLMLDDGSGMSKQVLLQAMRPGSRSPLAARGPADLGRFGLGLKTASFSQSRCLSVATREAGGSVLALRWDLDAVARTDTWQLEEGIDPELASEQDVIGRIPSDSGATVVMWSKVDRLPQLGGTQRQQAELLATVRAHLGMVFHRFIDERRLSIHLGLNPDPLANGQIKPWNPFFTERSHVLPGEVVRVGNVRCSFKGYVLPHRDRCTDAEWEAAAGPGGWVAQQGFYVYRNRRMLVDGDWLQLERGWRKDELFKLARIQLDFDSTLDQHWKIDIKKSRASPPRELREKLRDLATRVRQESERVFAHRGARRPRTPGDGSADDFTHVWSIARSAQGLNLSINREHPLVKQLGQECARTDCVLRMLEKSVPAARIWLEMNRQADLTQAQARLTDEEARDAITTLFSYLMDSCGFSASEACSRILHTEPLDQHAEAVQAVLAQIIAERD